MEAKRGTRELVEEHGSLDAFLDFVRQSRDGLRFVKKKPARWALLGLADEGMDPHELFARVIRSSEAEFLFSILYAKVWQDETRRLALLDALVTAPWRVWDDRVLDGARVAGCFNRAEDFEHLLKHHRERLLHSHEENGFIAHLSPDAYWRKRVRWYCAKRDFRRAWDELRKAERGFFIGTKKEAPRFGRIDLTWYVFEASQETVSIVLRELFAAMLERGLVSPTADEGEMALQIREYVRQKRDAQRRKKWGKAAKQS